jgi:hypothetical protein
MTPSGSLTPSLFVLGLLTFFLTSCIVSRHPVGIASASGPTSLTYTILGPVEDSSCGYRVLIFPGMDKEDTHEIIARLIKEHGADALVGVTVEHRQSVFAIPLFASDCLIVTGVAVKNVR